MRGSRFSTNLLREVWVALAALCVILTVSSTGFHFIEGWAWFDALYMVIITLSTVGYGEVHDLSPVGRLWAMATIFGGVGVMSFTFITLGRLTMMGLADGELRRVLARRRMNKIIEKVSEHHVICGYGRIGRTIAICLTEAGHDCVVVESDPDLTEQLELDDIPYVIGDATRERILRKAGITRARTAAVVTPSDPDNLYITLTARELHPELYVMARANDASSEKRLVRAGADRALSPHEIGGRQMASSLLRPTVVELLDLAASGDAVTFAMEEMVIHGDSELVGTDLMHSGLRQDFGVIIVAIKRDGEMVFNPLPSEVFQCGDVVISIGGQDDLARLQRFLQPDS